MVQIPDHLASYYEINRTKAIAKSSSTNSSEKISALRNVALFHILPDV